MEVGEIQSKLKISPLCLRTRVASKYCIGQGKHVRKCLESDESDVTGEYCQGSRPSFRGRPFVGSKSMCR